MSETIQPQHLSASLRWKIGEIPGEDGWIRLSSHTTFEQLALVMVQAGIDPKTVAALLYHAYWAVADCYGG